MSSTLISVLGIYVFIAVGFFAKMSFREKIDERTITLLSVYFLQIFLTFWGLLKRPIDTELIMAPGLYLLITLISLALMIPLARMVFSDVKDRSIATIAALIGNTGNLGIPLGIAIFGEASIPYTTLINLMNVFIVYTFGVYFYSRGTFSIADSLRNILKLPVLWAAMIAISLNLAGYTPTPTIEKSLQMGAYASMVIQLLLFGIYLYDVKMQTINRLLIGWVTIGKFILIPALTYLVLSMVEMPSMVKGILFLQMMMPLAVANVNLGSLYECKPTAITAVVMVTSVLFLGIVFAGIEIMKTL